MRTDEARIADAVEKCVAYANDGEGPIRKAADFLLILRTLGWPVAEVRTRALAELGKKFSAALPKHIP